jgi:hypothetical protein
MSAPRLSPRQRLVVEAAEDALSGYLREHYGPFWSHEHEEASERLAARLRALYEKHGVPADERQAGF